MQTKIPVVVPQFMCLPYFPLLELSAGLCPNPHAVSEVAYA
jgi:hypothetical protein